MPEATPTDPKSDAVGGATITVGGTTALLLLAVVVTDVEVGGVLGGGVCFFERMRSSNASLLFLNRGS